MKLLQKIKNKINKRFFGLDEIYENVNKSYYEKNSLLLYITEPFKNYRLSHIHQNQWQARELARIIGEFGFNVDVIHYSAKHPPIKKTYDLVVDINPHPENINSEWLSHEVKKIAYITGGNPEFSNQAEQRRLDDLFARRGVRLQPRRSTPHFNRCYLESFDGVLFIGNEYNLTTYSGFTFQKVFHIKNTGYDFLLDREIPAKSAHDFLYIASAGQVHKGLDLLLEVFADLPGLRLFVCSSFADEQDFCAAFEKELFHTPTIVPVGFVNIASSRFQEILDSCSYVVMPSCSEASCGSVLTAMSGGLIPIVSRECGFADDEVHHLEDCSIESIRRLIIEFSKKTPEWIAKEAQLVKANVRERYSPEAYRTSIRLALREILK
jgi:glycosyltransferase involved in cell wall biosynthesis